MEAVQGLVGRTHGAVWNQIGYLGQRWSDGTSEGPPQWLLTIPVSRSKEGKRRPVPAEWETGVRGQLCPAESQVQAVSGGGGRCDHGPVLLQSPAILQGEDHGLLPQLRRGEGCVSPHACTAATGRPFSMETLTSSQMEKKLIKQHRHDFEAYMR